MAPCFAHRSQADIKRSQYARRTRVSLARPIWSMMRPFRGMRRSMKKAIGDNMIPKEWGFEKGLELVKQAGFDGIELWLGDVPWFQMGTPDSEVRELRRKVENAGVVVSNVSPGLHWASPISARDAKVRVQGVRIGEREIQTAGLLGIRSILLVGGLVTPQRMFNE